MNKIELMTKDYWLLSREVRDPTFPSMGTTTEKALKVLSCNLNNLDPNRRVAQVTHELQFDIIEGDTKWRQPSQKRETSFQLIYFMKK